MRSTTKRGLLRLAVVFMVVWNLVVGWQVLSSAASTRAERLLSIQEVKQNCIEGSVVFGLPGVDREPGRPRSECEAEEKKAESEVKARSVYKDAFPPDVIALIEFAPPVVIGIVWGVLWGFYRISRWVLRGFGIGLAHPISEDHESLPSAPRARSIGAWFAVPRNVLVASVALIALSVSYYFLVSLPSSNAAKLQFERDKLEAEKNDRERMAEERKIEEESKSANRQF